MCVCVGVCVCVREREREREEVCTWVTVSVVCASEILLAACSSSGVITCTCVPVQQVHRVTRDAKAPVFVLLYSSKASKARASKVLAEQQAPPRAALLALLEYTSTTDTKASVLGAFITCFTSIESRDACFTCFTRCFLCFLCLLYTVLALLGVCFTCCTCFTRYFLNLLTCVTSIAPRGAQASRGRTARHTAPQQRIAR